jgi:hypothetical protein
VDLFYYPNYIGNADENSSTAAGKCPFVLVQSPFSVILSVDEPGGASLETYDIFISYRRDKGSEAARLLQMALSHRGYRVFLDVDNLFSGHFDERLLQYIENAPHFILILSPGTLERSADHEDFVRRELEHALKNDRNIVPMLMPGFEFPNAADLPESLRSLERYNGIAYSHDYFDATVARLVQYMPRTVEGSSVETPQDTGNESTLEGTVESPSAEAPVSADTYGAYVREPATSYIVFGLLTAWGYVSLCLGRQLIKHFQARRNFFTHRAITSGLMDIGAPQEGGFLVLADRAFASNTRWPILFTVGFAVAGLFTISIFIYFFLVREVPLVTLWPVGLIAVSSTLFYLLVLGFMVWVHQTMKKHDRYEQLLFRWFDDPRVSTETLPKRAFFQRWERFDQHVALFLILGLPIIFSPTVAAWHILYKSAVPLGVLMMPLWVFILAGIYHLWGVWLLLDIYNSHLRAEQDK